MPQGTYSIRDYGVMVDDRRRTLPYVDALRAAVKPGDVVLDIGTGCGIFAFLACQLGAARVYAVELDDVLEVARQCAQGNAGSERITWIKGVSTDVTLPERADVVIADLHGTMPFFAGNVQALIDARERHLKPGGLMIPQRDVMNVAPAEAASEFNCVHSPWDDNEYGIDLRAGKGFVVNDWWRASGAAVPRRSLLAPPGTWGVVDYASVRSSDLEASLEFVVERDATMHGYYVWFDTYFESTPHQTNSPLLPDIAYGRAFFPLEKAVAVACGDTIEARFSAKRVKGDHLYIWETRIVGTGGTKCAFRQSTFRSRPIILDEARRGAAGFRANLNLAGRIDLLVLRAMEEGMTLGEVAAKLLRDFPASFPGESDALDRVARLSSQYSQADELETRPRT